MDMRFQAGGPGLWSAQVVLTFAFKGDNPEKVSPLLLEAAPWLGIAPAWQDFMGERKEQTMFYGFPSLEVPRVLVCGLGDDDKLTLDSLRQALGQAVRYCRQLGLENLGLDVPALQALNRLPQFEKLETGRLLREVALAARLGLYRYTQWSTATDLKPDPAWMAFLLEDKHVPNWVQDQVRLGEAEAQGICLARDLANAPANVLTPSLFAEKAKEIADKYDFSYQVLDKEAMQDLGMSLLLSVAEGSAQAPKLAMLTYMPKDCSSQCQQMPLVLVGKGITFDSGGISLKPSANMASMKADMAGAAAVLGTFTALGESPIKPKCPIIGFMPCTENMPGGRATRPGDIIKSMAGKTVEIINTDAEGRLILADTLSYAQNLHKSRLLVDIATLTGACVVALGTEAAGLFTNQEALAPSLVQTGEQLGERLWHLPLWESSKEALKSEVADISNCGPREGGALHAAYFLQSFVEKGTPWLHLDIAGSDSPGTPLCPKGPSGFGVRTLTHLALQDCSCVTS